MQKLSEILGGGGLTSSSVPHCYSEKNSSIICYDF